MNILSQLLVFLEGGDSGRIAFFMIHYGYDEMTVKLQ